MVTHTVNKVCVCGGGGGGVCECVCMCMSCAGGETLGLAGFTKG